MTLEEYRKDKKLSYYYVFGLNARTIIGVQNPGTSVK